MTSLAAHPAMMLKARKSEGLRVCRAAWLLGLTVRVYQELEAGNESLISADVWERTVEVFGWPTASARE